MVTIEIRIRLNMRSVYAYTSRRLCIAMCGLLVNFFWMIAPDVCVQVVNSHKIIDFWDSKWRERKRKSE